MTSETPNSPKELFDMQRRPSCETDDPEDFWAYIETTALVDMDPSPYQVIKAIEHLLRRLEGYHFDALNGEDLDLTEYQRKIWREDYKHLGKALKHIRLMHPD